MNATRRNAFVMLAASLAGAGAAVALVPRRSASDPAAAISLATMIPPSFKAWRVDPRVLPLVANSELQRVVEQSYDQTLARTYVNDDGYQVMLSIAYGGRRNQGMDIHRPENCYPAQGLALRSRTVDATVAVDAASLPVKRLVAGVGARNEPITYWLVIGKGLASFGYGHRLALLKYGLTGQVPDGMLVRVSSIDSSESRSFRMQELFVHDLISAVSPGTRDRLLGTHAMGST